MEEKLKSFTIIISICISFLAGVLFCDFLTEPKMLVKMSGGELYYDESGEGRKEAVEQTSIEKIEINERAYLINLNTASKSELMDLPLIGEKTAEKIINYREKNSFASINDIMEVEGIGEKTFLKIKEYICVE